MIAREASVSIAMRQEEQPVASVMAEHNGQVTVSFQGPLVEALRHAQWIAQEADSDRYEILGVERLTSMTARLCRAVLGEITAQINALNAKAGPRWGGEWRRTLQELEAEQEAGKQVLRLNDLRKALCDIVRLMDRPATA